MHRIARQSFVRHFATHTSSPPMASNPARHTYDLAMQESAGQQAIAAEQFESAIDSYKTAHNSDPSCGQALFNLGIAYHHNKQLQKAIEAWQDCLHLDAQKGSERADVLTNLAAGMAILSAQAKDAQTSTESTKKAFDYIQRARQITPEDVEVTYNYAVLAEKLDLLDEAEEAYTKAVSLGLDRAKTNLVNVGAKRKIKTLSSFAKKN